MAEANRDDKCYQLISWLCLSCGVLCFQRTVSKFEMALCSVAD